MIGLNLKFKRAFGLVLENILGISTETHYNRKSTAYYHVLTTVSGWPSGLRQITNDRDRDVWRFEALYNHITFFS